MVPRSIVASIFISLALARSFPGVCTLRWSGVLPNGPEKGCSVPPSMNHKLDCFLQLVDFGSFYDLMRAVCMR